MNKFVIIVLCLLCLGAYVNSLNNSFIFDDKALIVNNPFIKGKRSSVCNPHIIDIDINSIIEVNVFRCRVYSVNR